MEFCQCDQCDHVVFAPVAPDADDACPSCENGQLYHLNREEGVRLMTSQLEARLDEIIEAQICILDERAMGCPPNRMEEQCLADEAAALRAALARLRRRGAKGA